MSDDSTGRGWGWVAPLRRGSLSARDTTVVELMDDPDCDPQRLERTYAEFPVINAVFSGWARTYRRFVRPMLSTTAPTRVLDIGSGGGDLARALAGWARRDGLRMQVVASDPDQRALAYVRNLPPADGVDYRGELSSDLLAAGERFDLVVSNHVVHHLDAPQLAGLLRDSERLAPASLHADITRGRLAYAGFGMLTWPFFGDSLIREDGLGSIRRSHRPAELERVIPDGWSALPQGPFRYLLAHGIPRG